MDLLSGVRMADGGGPSHTSWKVTPERGWAFVSPKENGLLRRLSSWSAVREAKKLLVWNTGWEPGGLTGWAWWARSEPASWKPVLASEEGDVGEVLNVTVCAGRVKVRRFREGFGFLKLCCHCSSDVLAFPSSEHISSCQVAPSQ